MMMRELLVGFGPIDELFERPAPARPLTFAESLAQFSAAVVAGWSDIAFAMRPAVAEMADCAVASIESMQTGVDVPIVYASLRERRRDCTREQLRDATRHPHVFATAPVVLDLDYERTSRYE